MKLMKMMMTMMAVIAICAVIRIIGLEKSATPQNDAEILQIQNTLQELGREHLAAQKHLGATASTAIQDQMVALKKKLNTIITPEQRAQIKAKIEQLRLNLKKSAPAA